jgi:hypothetical protein
MKSTTFMENREKLQKTMMKSLETEVQQLNPDLQSILIDDMITAFYNRLHVMKKIQEKQ